MTLDARGIAAKRKLGIYKDDSNGWLKIKNRNYSQAEGRHELLTGKVPSEPATDNGVAKKDRF